MQAAVILSQKDVQKLKRLAVAFAGVVARLEGQPAPARKPRTRREADPPASPLR